MDLSPDWSAVQSDVARLLAYFHNFTQGFRGEVAQQQRDYFLFLCWFYLAPLLCDLRNQAVREQAYPFDIPRCAILYGKSNCGKTRLIETLMRSMFGFFQFLSSSSFTRTNLRALQETSRRFPLVFDDLEKKRFGDHAAEIIKDEGLLRQESPVLVLSMNGEEHSFPTEIRKRCLMLSARASLPDHTQEARTLYAQVRLQQRQLSTALYREYLRRVMQKLAKEGPPPDILACTADTVCAIFAEATNVALPAWCHRWSMREYQEGKYAKVQAELGSLYETNPRIWEVRRREVILDIPLTEIAGLRKEIPDWLLKEGSKAGHLVLDRSGMEEFLGRRVGPRWRRWLRG